MGRNGKADVTKNKVIEKKHAVKKGRGGGGKGGADEDDSDVDDRGNVRGLIDYEYESDGDDSTYEDSASSSETERRKPRKAAIKAKKLIKKELATSNKRKAESPPSSPSSDDRRPAKKATKATGAKATKATKALAGAGVPKAKGHKTTDDFKAFEESDEDDGETLGS